jgi:hypothetical protein
MSIDSVYEQWERQVTEKARAQAIEQEAKQTLNMLYEARFGTMPGAIVEAIAATRDLATLRRWTLLVATRSAEDVAAAVQASAATA